MVSGRLVRFEGPRQVTVVEYEEAAPQPDEVRLETLYSGISAGTELTAYRGSNPYLQKRWDAEQRLFVSGALSLEYPVDAWGYEEVGRVAAVGADVERVEVGDVVYGTWGHRSTTTVKEDWAAARKAPAGLPTICGIFSRIGAIALNAVLDADIHVGETVAVFGQGVPGLLATQLARLNGGVVVAVDGLPARLAHAKALGADHTVDYATAQPAEEIRTLTDGRGADVTIEISGAYPALHEAVRSTAYNSRVVSAGFFQGPGQALFLGEEFHHNRVEIVCSQISGVSRRLDHRWSLQRLEQTALALMASGRLDGEALISHTMSVDNAAAAFELLDQRPAEALQVVLSFDHAEGPPAERTR